MFTFPFQKTDYSFAQVTQSSRTKHVHKLHPYKGKFIPQIPEKMLKKHFKSGQRILDPFMGSGTTLVQSNELGINSVGVDISEFNYLLTNVKLANYNRKLLLSDSAKLLNFVNHNNPIIRTNKKEIFLNKWYLPNALAELKLLRREIQKVKSQKNRDFFKIILAQTAHASRATKHTDVTTLKKPQHESYFCKKHNKHCQPPNNATKRFTNYTKQAISRLDEFAALKQSSSHKVVHADIINVKLKGKFDGIITSPPYVGQINYHDQAEHAFSLLKLKSQRDNEIGPLFRGRRAGAQKRYVKEMSKVLLNLKKYMKPKAMVFIVANDRFQLYPEIFENSNLKIVKKTERKVAYRNEGDQTAYSESIFQLTYIQDQT